MLCETVEVCLFSNELEAKCFALFDEDELTSGPFMIVDSDALPLLRIWLEIF